MVGQRDPSGILEQGGDVIKVESGDYICMWCWWEERGLYLIITSEFLQI